MRATCFLMFILFAVVELNAQRGIGTNNPNLSAVLDLTSTDQGFLPPRMTYAQMINIANPTVGLMVNCTDCVPVGVYYYDGIFYLNPQTRATSGGLSTLNGNSIIYTGSNSLRYGNTYTNANGITASVPYTGWGGNTHNPIEFNSTNAWGLTATLDPSSLTTGSGNARFNITGTISHGGGSNALFYVNLGGKNATLSYTMLPAIGTPVLENGVIPDSQLSASSSANNTFYYTEGRLNTTGPNWAVYDFNASQWFQVDLGQEEYIVGVATQGSNSSEQWIKTFMLQYSSDGTTFTNYNNSVPLTGNTDQNTVVRNNVFPAIKARYIRFNPRTWETYIQGRFEVYIE